MKLSQNVWKAKIKKKMAIVREDCDSFEIMPLDTAEKQGKKVFHTTKIDKFLASFSGGKDSQVCVRPLHTCNTKHGIRSYLFRYWI